MFAHFPRTRNLEFLISWLKIIVEERILMVFVFQGSSGSDRDSAWGSSSSSGGRVTARYGSYGSLTTDRYSSGSDRNRESPSAGYGSSAGSPYAARDRFDRNEAYLRIETELVKLTNEKVRTTRTMRCFSKKYGCSLSVFVTLTGNNQHRIIL